MTGRQNTNNAPYPSFNTNNQQNRNNTGNVRNNSNRITTTAQQAAPPPDGQLVDAMRNTSLSRTNNRPTGQVMAPSQATASSQASAPSRVSPQVTSSQANAFKTSSFGVNTSQATSTQASASQAATTSESALDLHEDGQPKIKPEDKKDKDPSFFDEQYALCADEGVEGRRLNIRVNRLAITYGRLPKKFHCYSVSLPQINNRVVTKRHIRRILMQEVLGTGQPWSDAFKSHKIWTDWDSLLVTGPPEEGKPSLGLPTLQGATTTATISFRNQTAAPGKPAELLTATIACIAVIERQSLTTYLSSTGIDTPNFNHSVWMRILNTMLRHFAANDPNTVTIGNKLFRSAPENTRPLRSGLLPQQGFFASIRPVNEGLHVHFNTVASAFYPVMPLHKFLSGYFGSTFSLNSSNQHIAGEIIATIRGLKVRYMYTPPDSTTLKPSPPLAHRSTGRLKTVNSLGDSANRVSRRLASYPQQLTWTVEQHFNTNVLRQPARIQYPDLPVINVGPKSTHQNPDAEVWIPMELLMIEPNQSLRTTVPSDDMKDMAKVSRRLPLDNVRLLEGDGLNLLQRGKLIASRVMQISATPELVTTFGRQLPLPKLLYRNGNADEGKMRNGKWDLRNQRFHTGSTLSQLFVIILPDAGFGETEQQQQSTLDGVARGLDKYGVTCSRVAQVRWANSERRDDLKAAYQSFAQPKNKIKTVLVILPERSFNVYAEIKTWGDLIEGVSTVCVTKEKAATNMSRPEFQGNLALKFNAKLGGKNHILGGQFQSFLHFDDGATMVVGADVTHPGPASIDYCPSIAAVVASESRDCVQFPGSMRLQASRTETVLDMQGMMIERLRHWKTKNQGKLPDSILYYRDGVSESQFAVIKQRELNAIKAAYTAVGGQAEVMVTVVVCTKRHQTRFYPPKKLPTGQEKDEYYDRNMNFKTGLVVDDPSIRAPHYFDFYLQGHAALQGTARPCHYFVIENGMDFGPDDLQLITYGLSWVYATSLTPISLVAPAYYADKMCERGRAWLRPLLVRGHPRRPPQASLRAILGQLGQDATEQEKMDHVATHFSTSRTLWPRATENPCHNDVAKTMFYV